MTHCFVLFSVLNIEVSCKVSFGAKKGIPQQKHLTWAVCFFRVMIFFFFLRPRLEITSMRMILMYLLKKSHPDN